jgi:phage repressor protein C with HTH and peptisase S24 domain
MASGHSEIFSQVVRGLLEDGLSVRFRASGRSMLPALRDGEYLIVAPGRAADIDIGDVVLCDTRRGPVAHRVQSVQRRADGEKQFTLRGDASSECDRPVAAPQVRGRIVSVERDGRRVSLGITGGRLARLALTAALRMRPVLVAAAKSWLAPSPVVRAG